MSVVAEAPSQTRAGPAGRRLPGTLLAGGTIVGLFVLAALFGPLILEGDPTALRLDQALQPPGPGGLFGTDNYGRDILLRLVYGARVDLQIGFFSVLPTFAVGTILGAVAGYFEGWVDATIMRVVDVIIAFPFLVLVIAIVAVLGPGLTNMYIAVAIVGWIPYARLVRGEVTLATRLDYVAAARVLGYSTPRILGRHVLPNVVVQPVIYATSHFVGYILLGSALGYLGLGVQPPNPEWGVMIAEGRNFLNQAPQMTLFPGLAIALLGAGCLMLGDGLADLLRPEVER